MSNNSRDKFRGCILGLAIGDALGYPLEFIRSLEDIDAITGGKIDLSDPALFSDDTQMSLCVAQALIESEGMHEKFVGSLSKYFVKWFNTQNEGSPNKRAPGASCLAGCENLSNGIAWSDSGVSSKGCGSAMRSAPVGLYWKSDMLKVIEWGRDSSILTHNDDTSMCSAAATALMVFLAMNDVPVGLWAFEMNTPLGGISQEFTTSIEKAARAAGERQDPWVVLRDDNLGEGWLGHETVASALYCAMMFPNDYVGAVSTAARTVGDSDSIACITGAIMGARLGIESIPTEWIEKIEAKDDLLAMADRLYEKSP